MEANNENRMGDIWGETAFKPSYIWNVLEIIRSKGFECFSYPHIAQLNLLLILKSCSLNTDNK